VSIRVHPRLLALLGLFGASALAAAESPGIRFGPTTVSQWRFGLTIRAVSDVTGVHATLPIPMDWPEQRVKVLHEEKSPQVAKLNYRTLGDGVRQLIVNVPKLPAGQEASAVLTLEVTKHQILEPADPTVFRLATANVKLTKYLTPSPYIESTDARIKSLAAEISSGKSSAWERAAAPFDWVRSHVKYEFAEQIKPGLAALQDGYGDCEELTSLVIALWRAGKIPGRAVWVPGHCYPEFCLADEKGQLHWLPCQAAGADRQFGSMIEDRPILQKGDNFRVPEERAPQRYVKQFLSAKDAAVTPEVKFIMERVKVP
jgi:transglutaminase-like putative cysteine protease